MSNFSLSARMASFKHAFWGFIDLLRSEHNARIHLLATVLVVALGLWLKLGRADWIALLVAIALVWVTEALNTALEYYADAAVPEHHPLIGKAKDVAATGVLIASLVAVLIGLLVFLPALWPLIT